MKVDEAFDTKEKIGAEERPTEEKADEVISTEDS